MEGNNKTGMRFFFFLKDIFHHRLREKSDYLTESRKPGFFLRYRITEVPVNAFIQLLQLSSYSPLLDYCVHVNAVSVVHQEKPPMPFLCLSFTVKMLFRSGKNCRCCCCSINSNPFSSSQCLQLVAFLQVFFCGFSRAP